MDISGPSCLDASGENSSADLVTDSVIIDNPTKKSAKKKHKKKKGKMKKKCSDNAEVLGVVEVTSQTCLSSGFSSNDIINEIGWSDCGDDIATTSYEPSKEEIGNGDVSMVAPNCNVRCSQTVGEGLKDKRTNDGKLVPEFSCNENTYVLKSSIQSGDSGRDLKGIIYGPKGSNSIEKKIISECYNYTTQDRKESLSFRCLSQDESNEIKTMTHCSRDSRTIISSKESGNVGSADSSSQCSSVSSAHGVTSSKKVERDLKQSRSSDDTVQMPSQANNQRQRGKENKNLIWQKTQKISRGACVYGEKRSNVVHVRMMDVGAQKKTLLLNHSLFSSDALLLTPAISSAGNNNFSQRVKVGNNEQKMCGTHDNVLIESPQWIAQQRFHDGIGQYISQSIEEEPLGNIVWGRPKESMNQMMKYDNVNHWKKGSCVNKSNLYRLRNKMHVSQKEALDVSSRSYLHSSSAYGRGSVLNNQWQRSNLTETNKFDGLPLAPACSVHLQLDVPHTRILGSPPDGSLHSSLASKEMKLGCLEVELTNEDNFKQEFTSRVTSQKWIPVRRNDSWMVKTGGVVDLKDKSFSCGGKAESYHESYSISVSGMRPSVGPGDLNFLAHETPKVLKIRSESPQIDKICKVVEGINMEEIKRDYAADFKAENTSLLYIGSQMALQALNSSYRLQIASESFQLATGSPLAEFERLLHSASPVIAPAFVLQRCAVCFGNQSIQNSLCKHQIPSIPLGAVWNWYQKPGSYGLEVKAQDSQKLKGSDIDMDSFHAHFVPFLSAVQLFGQSHHSKHSDKGIINTEVPEMGEAEQCTDPSKPPRYIGCSEAVEPNPTQEKASVPVEADLAHNLSTSEINGSSDSTSLLAWSEDIELVFDFFEYEQPQQRKPLYDKITELIKFGTSNHRVFGDPSKLDRMNLHDLHPASWYSVAWYPIYRIPEGNLRASFLTYHSLGHLVHRCIPTDSLVENASCVVSPVLGLQSYNAQGECWFYPKKPVEGPMPFDSSEILKERLRTLEETALLFARGYVYKDNVKVSNHQSDYEFFLSRKH